MDTRTSSHASQKRVSTTKLQAQYVPKVLLQKCAFTYLCVYMWEYMCPSVHMEVRITWGSCFFAPCVSSGIQLRLMADTYTY